MCYLELQIQSKQEKVVGGGGCLAVHAPFPGRKCDLGRGIPCTDCAPLFGINVQTGRDYFAGQLAVVLSQVPESGSGPPRLCWRAEVWGAGSLSPRTMLNTQ